MCKSLADGGGRCFYHLNKELSKAGEKVKEFEKDGDMEKSMEAQEEYNRIQLQVDATMTGQKALRDEIEKTQDPTGVLNARLSLGEATITAEKNKPKRTKPSIVSDDKEESTGISSGSEMSQAVTKSLITSIPFTKEAKKEKGSNMHDNIVSKYVAICKEKGVDPDLIGWSGIATGYQSKVGNYLEHGFSVAVNNALPKNAKHFIGKKIESDVTSYRKKINRDIVEKDNVGISSAIAPDNDMKKEAIEELHRKYHLNKEWTEKMLTPAKSEITTQGKVKHTYSKISLPDSITIKSKENGEKEVRIGEAKLSGQLDSKNLPKNIEELMRKGPYDDIPNTKVERAILLTGTREDAKGNFPMSNAWVAESRRQGISLPVESNQNAFKWASGKEISKEEYYEGILAPIENFAADRIYKQLHTN